MAKNICLLSLIVLSNLVTLPHANATTHEELLRQQKQSATKQPKRSTKAPKYERVDQTGLIEGSDILSNGSIWTIVPKNAIIYKPASHASKVANSPKGKFVNWNTFLAKNPAWLSSYPVDLQTSSGAAQISFETLQLLQRRGKIVVAVHNKGPVSVTPDAIQRSKSN